jgi:oxazoline/thiazoline synthase
VTGSLLGFRRDLRAEVVTGEATYLVSEQGVTALEAPPLESLAPLLDGTRDAAALCRDAGLAPAQVDALTRQLADAGLVTTRSDVAAPEPDAAALAYWEAAGLDAERAAATLAGATVSVEAVGGADDTAVRAALAAAGLRSTDTAGPADLAVVVCGDYLDPELGRIDRRQRAAGRPWLLAKPAGTRLWIGPVFRPATGDDPDGDDPEGTACWHCLAHRLSSHRRAEQHLQSALGRSGPAARPAVGIAPLGAAGAELVALEAAKWLAGHRHPGQRAVWTLDTLDLRDRRHELRARPECPDCGDPAVVRRRATEPVELTARSAQADGRAMSPEQTLDRYRHLVSPVTGVVRDLRPDRRGPAFLHAYRAVADLAVRPGAPAMPVEHGGKGVTAAQAECGALCEALERHSGCFHGDELRIPARYRDLGADAVHPDSVQLFAAEQYATRADWNPRHAAFQHVPEPFDDDARIDWTPVWSLTGQRHRLVPTGLLYYGGPGPAALRPDSNGAAAGASLEDAILQGFFELVERDAVALWWYNRTPLPAVDLDAFADPWVAELRDRYAALHREVWVLDLTADLGVPTMAALSRRTDKPAEDVIFGFGAHFDPRIALRRALTELNQLLPAVAGADRDGRGYAHPEPEALRWWTSATVANQPYLAPAGPARGPAAFPYRPGEDLRADVRRAERVVADAGLELLVLDQTRPDVGLPVAKVLVPGLRHFWARYAPGRLYDVPVRLGRLATPTPYGQLNPLPLFV